MELNWSMSIQMNRSGLTVRLQWVKCEANTSLFTLQMSGSKYSRNAKYSYNVQSYFS